MLSKRYQFWYFFWYLLQCTKKRDFMAINILRDITIKATIKKVQETKKQCTINDGGGLSLNVTTKTHLWIFRYQSPTKYKRRKRTLGLYPEVSIAQARTKVKQWKELLQEGKDPQDEERKAKEKIIRETKNDFCKIVDEWMDTQSNLSVRHLKLKRALFENHVKPSFIKRTIQSISHDEIAVIVERIGKKTPETASRILIYCNQLWKYATTKKYVPQNIIAFNIDKASIIKKAPQKHLAKITDENTLKELINALYTYKGNVSTKNVLLFVLHAPLRASNIVNLTWDKVDFEKKVIIIPRNEMKIANPNLPSCKIPLTGEVIKILREQQSISFNDWVFPGSSLNRHLNAESSNKALRTLGFIGDKKQTLHSFRGTFRSLCDTYQDEHKQPFEIKEIALDHYSKNQASLSYSHKADYEKSLRILFSWWSEFLIQLRDKEV